MIIIHRTYFCLQYLHMITVFIQGWISEAMLGRRSTRVFKKGS